MTPITLTAKNRKNAHQATGLHIVALFEGAKGTLVLLAGFGLLTLIHRDLHHVAEELVSRFHMNPAHHYPKIFIDAATHVTDTRLWVLSASALLYATVRFVEAYGLWRRQPWAEWFAVLTGGMYIPIEIFELLKGATWAKVVVLAVNTGIVGYLVYILIHSNKDRKIYHKQKRHH
jgi:uncharacterized membrane protein (DUF2068 family)